MLTPYIVFLAISIILPMLGAWWGAWLAGTIVGFFFFGQNLGKALLSAFLMGSLLCLVWSLGLWMDGGDLISEKIAQLFSLPNGIILILVSAVINGLIALLGAGLGSSLRHLLIRS